MVKARVNAAVFQRGLVRIGRLLRVEERYMRIRGIVVGVPMQIMVLDGAEKQPTEN
jgi:hypothetical protein